jgi:putative tryptophan/tyrosine transport system substrate-binding protein
MRPYRLLVIGFGLAGALVAGLDLMGIAAAEEAKVWRIGACHVGLDHTPPHLPLLRAKLAELGYVVGRNLQFDFRNLADEVSAEEAARAFAARNVDLMLAFEDECARAMHRVTTTIPIVFSVFSDPVAAGFVRSLARPGTNMTGSTLWAVEPAKEIELLKEIDPAVKRLLILTDPSDSAQAEALSKIRVAAKAMGIELLERPGSTPGEIDGAFKSAALTAGDAVIVASGALRSQVSGHVLELALRQHVPFVGPRREWVAEGALFSYGPDVPGSGVELAIYIDKILKGAAPATLPVEQPVRFQLVLNARTAKLLGIRIPDEVLARADEVIE